MMRNDYYRSIRTPVLRQMYERLRKRIMAIPDEDREREDCIELIAMRDELDRRSGGKPSVDVDFEKYITD